jgi:hypothetical protein
VEWLKAEALSSNPSTARRKDRKKTMVGVYLKSDLTGALCFCWLSLAGTLCVKISERGEVLGKGE